MDWCDGTPLMHLARRSFALHAELADDLSGDWGYRRMTTFGGIVGRSSPRSSRDIRASNRKTIGDGGADDAPSQDQSSHARSASVSDSSLPCRARGAGRRLAGRGKGRETARGADLTLRAVHLGQAELPGTEPDAEG